MNRAWNGDLTLQDRVKRCYQRAFGAEHMMADEAAALARLRAECASLSAPGPQETCFEPLGNGLCRLHLRPALAAGLSVETIHRLFVWSAGRPRDGRADFDAALEALAVTDEARAWVDAYRAQGCPPPRHSDAYRRAFAPAYRVVDAAFARAMPLLLRLERLSRGLAAIDGPCASGKTTLANALGGALGLTVFHMDDFFLRPSQRTPERLAEPGGNVDRERFAQEVLGPLAAGGAFSYRPYDCHAQALAAPVRVTPTPVCLIEGAYCLHPALLAGYALRVFVRVDAQTQRARILERNGARMLRRFEAEWIPMENAYFRAFSVEEGCDVILAP
ncbi:MAG TPA: hypothetical protein IAA66_01475 [Candidatus Avichristensenella intestinipullorum]|uniref:Uridine kinase n=1 Tax=Candidatus Avichristensenella intestinipullorum TaxID=2840693 RepID=A0A9D1CHZ0_9FIRM|nr:hypothetical protein [Candidatus Avichristensenella intestinipullorum]